ncbi:MAG: hypothetical protein CL607_07430 [Anaerolineaceae bacterium]|nr:hypothetical protein [Anaerolineaceae bacterium]
MPDDIQTVRQAVENPERLSALANTQLLDSPDEETFDRLTKLASRILKVPVSLISLVDIDRQFFKSQVGLGDPWKTMRQTPISHSFCKYVVASGEMLVVEDARQHPIVCDNPAIQDLDVASYLGMPLTSPDGWQMGSLCVVDHEPRAWTDDDIEVLQTLAQSVIAEIQLRHEVMAKEKALADLQHRNEELDAFAHTVSHNLKNPISAIIGWSELNMRYVEKVPKKDVIEGMQYIDGLAHHANDIISALLLLATVSRDEVELKPLNMYNILDDALARLHPDIEKAKAVIKLPDSSSFPSCMGYRQWIEEIWVNYITNALKYGGQPPEIEFGAEQSSDDCVRYWIKDNGEGLQQNELDKLFVPFSRLPNTATVEGHGLGLSIVLRIVEKLGGEVDVTSKIGDGTTFSFTLPIR